MAPRNGLCVVNTPGSPIFHCYRKGKRKPKPWSPSSAISILPRCSAHPLQRARRTCVLSGLGEQMQICKTLTEWNYGDYEGMTTAEIRQREPTWSVWTHGCPNGEQVDQMQRRSQQTIDTMLAIPEPGDIALFAHGHSLRALAGTWLGLGATGGQLLQLGTGTISVLGWERETRTLERWNAPTNSRPDD